MSLTRHISRKTPATSTTPPASNTTIRNRSSSPIANCWNPFACLRGARRQWRDFAAWFARQYAELQWHRRHQAFEEIRGVIAGRRGGILESRAYLASACGNRSSLSRARATLRSLREVPRLAGRGEVLRPNVIARLALPRRAALWFRGGRRGAGPHGSPIAVVLKTLKEAIVLLCGDSNQIVHPISLPGPDQEPVLARPESGRAAELQGATDEFPQRSGR